MKHIIKSLAWNFEFHPIPGFRCIIYPGTDAHKSDFIPAASNVIDTAFYTARDRLRSHYQQICKSVFCPLLPEGKFKISLNKEGGCRVIRGKCDLRRCFLFLGYEHISSSGKNAVCVDRKSTGTILMECKTTYIDVSSRVEAAMLLDPGQSARIRFGHHIVCAYTWDGSDLHYDENSITMKIQRIVETEEIVDDEDDYDDHIRSIISDRY